MKPASLRIRLLSAAALSVSLALMPAAFGLVALFEHHVERRLDSELGIYLSHLIGHVELGDNGRIRVVGDAPAPSFNQPLSGLYWQIQDEVQPTLLRSRSLWDYQIPLPEDELRLGAAHRHELPGPAGQSLLVREQQFILEPSTLARRLRVAVAADRADLLSARAAFTTDILPYLILLALTFLLASYVQVRMGLSPLKRVRRGVFSVRAGRTQRLTDQYPEEVSPLVDEINELLRDRDRAVENARTWTADLAHGLKTPLTALGADAQRLRRQGEDAIADDIDDLVHAMRARVDRELTRARLQLARRGGGRAALGPVIDGLVRTLKRTPRGEELEWRLEIPFQASAAITADDLAELAGNLLENAVKWGRSLVCVRVFVEGEMVCLRIEDDGPGVAPEAIGRLAERGVRLDEQKDGAGLGLAIVGDIVAAYKGRLQLEASALGGLAVQVRLPPAQYPH